MSPNTKQIAHFLVIENIQMTDSGYYSCTATNRIGSDVKVVHIIVKGKTDSKFVNVQWPQNVF